jgi:hypothetical protein
MIGEKAEAVNRHFNGWIDEVAVYSRALRPDQILGHYIAGGGGGLQAAFTLALPNGVGAIGLAGSMSPSGAACLSGTASSLALPYLSLGSAGVTMSRAAGGTAAVLAQGTAPTPFGGAFFFGAMSTSGSYSLTTRAAGSFLVGGFPLNHQAAFELTPSRFQGGGQLSFHGYSVQSTLQAERNGPASLSGSVSRGFAWEMFGRSPLGDREQPFAAASGNLELGLDTQLQVKARFNGTFAAWYSPVYQQGVFEPPANLQSLKSGFYTQPATFTQKPYSSLRVDSSWDLSSEGVLEVLENFEGISRYLFDAW